MKRLTAIAVLVLAAALLVPTAGVAKRSHGKAKTYKADAIVKLSDLNLADAKGDGATAGDIETFTITVFDSTGKTQGGTGHGYCVLGVAPISTCTTVTGDGKGKIVLTWESSGDATRADEAAIVGGTRRYRNLRGDGTVSQVSASDPTTYRVKLKGTL
jgi:hypothetical protein